MLAAQQAEKEMKIKEELDISTDSVITGMGSAKRKGSTSTDSLTASTTGSEGTTTSSTVAVGGESTTASSSSETDDEVGFAKLAAARRLSTDVEAKAEETSASDKKDETEPVGGDTKSQPRKRTVSEMCSLPSRGIPVAPVNKTSTSVSKPEPKKRTPLPSDAKIRHDLPSYHPCFDFMAVGE